MPLRSSMTAVAVLLVLAGASCGDDAPTEAAETTAVIDRAEWGASLEQACDELNEEYQDLVDTDPADRDEAVAYAERIEEFALASVDLLDGAGVPSEDRRSADTLAGHFDDLATAAGDLADAADQRGRRRAGRSLVRGLLSPAHQPRNSGWRRSRNAARPSAKSPEAVSRSWLIASSSNAV